LNVYKESYKKNYKKFTMRTFKDYKHHGNDLIDDVVQINIEKRCENANCQKHHSKKIVLKVIKLPELRCFFCGQPIDFSIDIKIGVDKGLK